MPTKDLSNFWKTLEIPLFNCEINHALTWLEKCVTSTENRLTTFAITDTKFYVPAVAFSTQDKIKLLQQLKSDF